VGLVQLLQGQSNDILIYRHPDLIAEIHGDIRKARSTVAALPHQRRRPV
jgi:hypothetical protein